MLKLIIVFIATSPAVALAQNLQGMASTTLGFIDGTIIPFLLGIGFLFFMVNVIRYFVFGSAEQDGREKAKQLAIYSVVGFVTIVVFWGIINLLTSSIGLDCTEQPAADYIDADAAENFSTNPCPQNGSADENSQPALPGQSDSTNPPTTGPNSEGNVACALPTTSGAVTTIITSPANCRDLRDSGSVNLSTVTANGQMDLDDPDTWLGGTIRTYPRPWRDYFWANWNRNGSNADNPMAECLLPDGTIEQLPRNECDDLKGQVVSTNPGTDGNSFQLTNCTYTDTNGQRQTVQVTAEDCQELQAGSDTDTPNQPIDDTGSGNGSGGPTPAPEFNYQIQ